MIHNYRMKKTPKKNKSTKKTPNKAIKHTTKKMELVQYIPVKCEAITKTGEQCTRDAVFKLDLKKERKLLGIPLPKINCCIYCSQHTNALLKTLSLRAVATLNPLILKQFMTPDQKLILSEMNKAKKLGFI
jgi:hypothetical protein